MAHEDLEFLKMFGSFYGLSVKVSGVWEALRRLWEGQGRSGEPWEGLGKGLSFLTLEFLN